MMTKRSLGVQGNAKQFLVVACVDPALGECGSDQRAIANLRLAEFAELLRVVGDQPEVAGVVEDEEVAIAGPQQTEVKVADGLLPPELLAVGEVHAGKVGSGERFEEVRHEIEPVFPCCDTGGEVAAQSGRLPG